MTNWYAIFYWLTVADGIKEVFNVLAIIGAVALVISIIGLFVSASSASNGYSDKNEWTLWTKTWKRVFTVVSIFTFISTLITVFIPTKKDALIIIAGGAVGNFVTQDSSARKIPSEVMMLLRTKIKDEINETTIKEALSGEADTLKNKSKEELLLILKNKK